MKKRSGLEEDHAQGLKKISKATLESIRREEHRQGSYAIQLSEITRAQDHMAENGMQFSLSLHQMHEDLNEMCNTIEAGRKHWKHEGLTNEKKVKDAESLLERSKARYDAAAQSYDRVRTGDSSGKSFGIKGPKSAEQREEDLHKKAQAADQEYLSKVQAAQAQRTENLTSSRPQAVKAIQDLVSECDSGLILQLQKFGMVLCAIEPMKKLTELTATFNEKLLVSNGLVVSPVRPEAADPNMGPPSMRTMVSNIDNEKDFHTFIISHTSSLPPRPAEIKYEKHSVLATTTQMPPNGQRPPTASVQNISQPLPNAQPQSFAPIRSQAPPPLQTVPQVPQSPSISSVSTGPSQGFQTSRQVTPNSSGAAMQNRGPSIPSQPNMQPLPPQPLSASQTSPQMASQPFSQPPQQQAQASQPAYNSYKPPGSVGGNLKGQPQVPANQPQKGPNGSFLPSFNPVFGMHLEALFRRDESAVPMVVYQCIQAVDLFGLEVEGIYRLSGNAAHINQLKAVFDHDSSVVNFQNPESFFHDVNSVAGLLKQFFRDLPDPLLTSEHYSAFIDAARIEEEVARRDSLHAVINSLPDPNYATLRALTLHLHRVSEHQQVNRMSTSNLAICFA